MSADQPTRTPDNPELAAQLDELKERLHLKTDEQLISKALSLLTQMIELEDKGYKIGAWKDNLLDRDVITYQILPEK
ncbi:hypothetical protein GZH47_32180 (plasmid) [Paenibacillus rhizovicinus]|uniref:Uncharacterized protein n=1 Tax=Paenibacillus rhizovicinus TaxID=2704463 RepID=A0A6C0PAT7_9BACL|nr:hypothetical protein [Paenibacillus rhizovicinus]QHW35546.1 hypothetical protein GZH47_32180 [Paenibacillus rhizovicinus]